jgi:hypothetical protein
MTSVWEFMQCRHKQEIDAGNRPGSFAKYLAANCYFGVQPSITDGIVVFYVQVEGRVQNYMTPEERIMLSQANPISNIDESIAKEIYKKTGLPWPLQSLHATDDKKEIEREEEENN